MESVCRSPKAESIILLDSYWSSHQMQIWQQVVLQRWASANEMRKWVTQKCGQSKWEATWIQKLVSLEF